MLYVLKSYAGNIVKRSIDYVVVDRMFYAFFIIIIDFQAYFVASLVDRRDSLGSCKPQFFFKFQLLVLGFFVIFVHVLSTIRQLEPSNCVLAPI
jgi:hypothetical protein